MVIYLRAAVFSLFTSAHCDSRFVSLLFTSHRSPVFPDSAWSTCALRYGRRLLQCSQVSTGWLNTVYCALREMVCVSFLSSMFVCGLKVKEVYGEAILVLRLT